MQNGAIFSRVVQESTKRDVVDEKRGNGGGTEKSCLSPSWVSRAPSLLCARLKNAKKITAVGYKCIK